MVFNKIICHNEIKTTKEFVLNMFMNLSLLFITLNILAPTNDISFITTSYNCSYPHVSLFNVSIDKFGKLNNDC